MSIVRMRKKMQTWFKQFMLVLAVVFAVGWVGVTIGTGGLQDKGNSLSGALAKINRDKVDRRAFETRFYAKLEEMREERLPSAFEEAQIRGQMFDEEVDRILRMQAAKKERVRVSRREVGVKINEIITQQIDQEKARLAGRRGGKITEKAFEAELKKSDLTINKLKGLIRKNIDVNMVRQQLLNEKLNEKLKKSVNASDKAIRESYDEVQFSQITIGTQKRSEAQAEQRAKEISEKLKKGADFAALAKEFSDDPYKTAGGERGYPMRRAYMEKVLADAVFGLKPGKISEPVKTPQGYIIVKLNGRQSTLPADYNDPKKKKGYRDSYLAQEQYRVQGEYFDNLLKTAKIVVYDPELKGYQIIKEMSTSFGSSGSAGLESSAEKAIKEFKRALDMADGSPDVTARSYTQIGYLYNWMRKPGLFSSTKEERLKYRDLAKKALESALEYSESDDLRLMLADIYIEEGKYAKALENLEIVTENAPEDKAVHTELLKEYNKIKRSQKVAGLIAQERKWLADYEERTKDQPQAGQFTIPTQ